MNILSWLLTLPPIVVILLVSLILSLVSILVYKYTTNQAKLKSIQEEQKTLKDEMKKNQNNPDKLMKLQKRAMEISMEVFPESMKSMIFTLIPFMLVFTWLAANMAYMPILPGQEFNTTVHFENIVPQQISINVSSGLEVISPLSQTASGESASWTLKGTEGTHTITYNYGTESYHMNVLVTNERKYLTPEKLKQKKFLGLGPSSPDSLADSSNIKSINIDLEKIRPLGPSIGMNWFWIYFISSFVFSTVFRKLLKVY